MHFLLDDFWILEEQVRNMPINMPVECSITVAKIETYRITKGCYLQSTLFGKGN